MASRTVNDDDASESALLYSSSAKRRAGSRDASMASRSSAALSAEGGDVAAMSGQLVVVQLGKALRSTSRLRATRVSVCRGSLERVAELLGTRVSYSRVAPRTFAQGLDNHDPLSIYRGRRLTNTEDAHPFEEHGAVGDFIMTWATFFTARMLSWAGAWFAPPRSRHAWARPAVAKRKAASLPKCLCCPSRLRALRFSLLAVDVFVRMAPAHASTNAFSAVCAKSAYVSRPRCALLLISNDSFESGTPILVVWWWNPRWR